MLSYLPLVIILGGLGIMAYFLTRSGKKSEDKRVAVAEQRGWDYTPYTSAYVLNVPDEDRNIMYKLSGKSEAGIDWEMTARCWKTIEKSSTLNLELNASSEFTAGKRFDDHFLIMPHDGIVIPDFILAEIFKRLDFPVDTPRVNAGKLPEELNRKYALYAFSPPKQDWLSSAAETLNNWWTRFPGKNKALIMTGGPGGVKVRTEMQIEKETEMEFFVDSALALID